MNIFKTYTLQAVLAGLSTLFLALALPVAASAVSPGAPGDCPAGTYYNRDTRPPSCTTEIRAGGLPKPEANSKAIKTILVIVNGLAGAIALLVIVISGLHYITSGGDPQNAAKAKNGIIYALLGVAVVLAAQAIVAFLLRRV